MDNTDYLGVIPHLDVIPSQSTCPEHGKEVGQDLGQPAVGLQIRLRPYEQQDCDMDGAVAGLDILPYSKGEGRPPVPRGLNVIAMKRRGVPQEIRTATNDAFKLLISDDYNTTQAIEKIKAEIPMNEYIEKMIDFIQTSKRGVLLKSHKSGYQSLSDE